MKAKLLLLTAITCMFMSCSVKRDYQDAISMNSIYGYETFLELHPKNKYSMDVTTRLKALCDDRLFNEACATNTIGSFEKYLREFPNGNHTETARAQVKKLKKAQEDLTSWERVKNTSSISALETWIQSNSSNPYVSEANTKLKQLKEAKEEDDYWKECASKNTISSYQSYLVRYPNGANSLVARNKIAQLREEEEVRPEWEKALKANTYEAYWDFYNSYQNTSYGPLAARKLDELEDIDWNKATKKNTAAAYDSFVEKYPWSSRKEEAEKRSIDLQVSAIMAGQHGYLPPSQKNYDFGSSLYYTSSTVEIVNQTDYTLTVMYSGNESKKVVLYSNSRKEVTLPNGTYKVAAKVDAKSVMPYAGTDSLLGGDYENTFYIVTSRY